MVLGRSNVCGLTSGISTEGGDAIRLTVLCEGAWLMGRLWLIPLNIDDVEMWMMSLV